MKWCHSYETLGLKTKVSSYHIEAIESKYSIPQQGIMNMGLTVEHVDKSFGQLHVIKDLSMEVKEGSIFGFLGANGAGKTTTMRMILDILRPDSGRITCNGKDMREIPRHNLGYLPEERGLYPKVEVQEQLLFLARLNGLTKAAALAHLDEWLERFDILQYRTMKVEELSKGNQQKIQFLATILHDPLILIMDEPFSGLDPVNANLLKEALLEMHRRGKTMIFSTHQLEQVEELCEDVVIIDKGQTIIAGSVREVKRQQGRNSLRPPGETLPVRGRNQRIPVKAAGQVVAS